MGKGAVRKILLGAVASILAVAAYAQSDLTNLGCAQEDHLRSMNGAVSTQVTFVNHSGVPIRTYWLNYEGKRVFYREIAPGASYVQQTYVTHPWVITNDRSGHCIAIYQPQSFPSAAVVQ